MAWTQDIEILDSKAWLGVIPEALRREAATELEELSDSGLLVLGQRTTRTGERQSVVVTASVVIQLVPLAPDDDIWMQTELGLEWCQRLGWRRGLWWAHFFPAAAVDLERRVRKLLESRWVDWAESEVLTFEGGGLTVCQPPVEPRLRGHWDQTGVTGAWCRGMTGEGVHCAVIDSAFDVTHGQLQADASACGVFSGARAPFAGGTKAIADLPKGTDRLHGTLCAGLVGARRAGASQAIGAAYKATLSLLVPRGAVFASQLSLARAIGFALDPVCESLPSSLRSRVVSYSRGPQSGERRLTGVLRSVLDEVAARSTSIDCPLLFFATPYDKTQEPGVDAVTAHDAVLAVGSAWVESGQLQKTLGPRGLDILGPGIAHSLTLQHSTGAEAYGTSVSAPVVAGVAALLIGEFPSLTAGEIRTCLLKGAMKMPAQTKQPDDIHGYGWVSYEGALEQADRLMQEKNS